MAADAGQHAFGLTRAAAFVAQRLHRLQVGRRPRGVEAADQAEDERGGQPLHDDPGRHAAFQHRARAGNLCCRPREEEADQHADHAADRAEQNRLAQDHAHDPAPAPAHGAQRADLTRPLHDAHDHRAHHAQAADEDGDGRHAPGKALQVRGPLLAHIVFAGPADGEVVVQILDTGDDLVDVAVGAHAHLEEAHLALLLRDGLGVFQGDDAARLFHALAGFVDAHDAVGHAVDTQVVVQPQFERIRGAPADGDLFGAGHRFAFDDAVVVHGNRARIVAVDQEIGHVAHRDPGEDARLHGGHVRHRFDALGQVRVQVAEDHVEGIRLGHEQIVGDAQCTAVVAGEAVGQCTERDNRRDTDGDAENGQDATGGATPEILEDHDASALSVYPSQWISVTRRP